MIPGGPPPGGPRGAHSNIRRGKWAVSLVVAYCLLACCSGCSPSSNSSPAPLLILGRTGYGPREFSYPRAIAIDKHGNAFVVDKTARIQRYDIGGNWQAEWKTPVWEAGKPTGLGVDDAGRVFVADTHYARVLVYSGTGELLRTIGSYGEACGEFHLPTDVAVLPDDGLLVSEYGGNDRLTKFGGDGSCLASFGGAGAGVAATARPQGICVNEDGSFWVADSRNHRVCRFRADLSLESTFGGEGRDVGKLRFPYGIDRLSDGTLVLAEYGNNRIQRFRPNGESVGVWGGPGREPGQLAYPWAVAVDPKDRVWIVDSGNNRIQIIDGMNGANWSRGG